MSYISQFEAELLKTLNEAKDTESIVKWVSAKILESYRNGIAAGQKRGQPNPKGKERASGSATQAK